MIEEKSKNKKTIVMIITIVVLALAVVGVSYAYYVAYLRGHKVSEISLANARLTYTEADFYGEIAEFNISATSDDTKNRIKYIIYVEPQEGNTIPFDEMKFTVYEKYGHEDASAYRLARGYRDDNFCAAYRYEPTSGKMSFLDINSSDIVNDTCSTEIRDSFEEAKTTASGKQFNSVITYVRYPQAVYYYEDPDRAEFNFNGVYTTIDLDDINKYCVFEHVYYNDGTEVERDTEEKYAEEGVCAKTGYGLVTMKRRDPAITTTDYVYGEGYTTSAIKKEGFYKQIVERNIMGGIIYYEAINGSTSSDRLAYSKDFRIVPSQPEYITEETVNGDVHQVDFADQIFKYKVSVFAVQSAPYGS